MLYPARVVKLVDTTDLKSVGEKSLYRFKSGPGHQQTIAYRVLPQAKKTAFFRKS
uniref:Uncharacterized protein n=1 Tax=Candidatus Nitrotoga fabula TaxID=2182327 RepID=A0A2X0R801_9PROT|nr:protein of unknown function [Candidatus Nitrotoga fabula]